MSPANPSAWEGRAVLHVDMDAFFASVEQLDHPEWRGKPVIVGGDPDGRGVVSAASYEARAFGVRSAMPSAQAARLCPDAIWVWPRMERYVELSRAVRAVFESFTPAVQPVSIDEAFLDVTPGEHGGLHPVGVAKAIQSAIADLGLSASVGVGTSKTVAKIASDFDKPAGLTVVNTGEEAAFLAPLPVGTLSGIGPVARKKLERLGLKTLGDLAELDHAEAVAILGSGGATWTERARGIDSSPVHRGRIAKSVSHERTFSSDISDLDEVRSAVRKLSALVARRLRSSGIAGRTVTIKLRFADFTTRTAQQTLEHAVDLEDEIFEAAIELLENAWSPGAALRLLGVGVSGLASPLEQLELFDESAPDDERKRRLAASLDEVVARFGKDAIGYGAPRRLRPATPAQNPPDVEEP